MRNQILAAATVLLAATASTSVAGAVTVSVTPATVEPGGSVQVKVAVERYPATVVVSIDGKRLRTVKVRKARGSTSAALPRDIAPGRHRLTACVKKRCRSVTVRVNRKAQPDPSAGEPSAAPAAITPPAADRPTAPPDPARATTPPAPGPGGTPPAPGAGPGPGQRPDFTAEPNPLDVQAHTDAAHRATKRITVAGGTLETTGADGTHYKLTVPPNALLSDERISMAPIASVDGLPFSGGLAAGVQLEPSGLRFADFVTLEISNHPPVSPQEETGFLYQRDGVEFQLYPLKEDLTKTTFKILHFSGVGIARGTEAERNAQLLRRTTDAEGQLSQYFATVFRPDKQFVDDEGVKWALRAYHDHVLKPLVDAALTDDGLAIQAINRYLGWGRMIALLIGDEFMPAERQAMSEAFVAIMRNAVVKAHRRCVDENRPEELPAILAWWRNAVLAGGEDEMPIEAWTAISSCARFELDFHTKIVQEQELNVEGPEVWKGEVLAENVIVEPDPEAFTLHGSKDAQYVDFRVEIPPHKPGTGCWHGGGDWTKTFPFTVSRLEMRLNPIQQPDGNYSYPPFDRRRITVSVTPFDASEWQYTADCNGSGGGAWGRWLSSTFLDLHEDEVDEEFGGVVFTDWTVPTGGGSMLGAKTYFRTKSLSGYKTREETTLELYHAPIH